MIKNLTFLLFFCVLFSCKTGTTQAPVDQKAIIDSTITAFQKTLLEQQIDSVFKKYHFNGSIAVFKDSDQLYRKESGYSDFKRKAKIDSNTVFAIGSISKQFTAVLILLQMEQGKLNVKDKVSKYLKEFKNKDYENITIHQLLNHTSGLNLMGGKLMFKSGTDFSIPMTDLMLWEKLLRQYPENLMIKMQRNSLRKPE